MATRTTNSTTTGNPNPGTVKLRESCELCAAAKVKCNKEKSACSRCLKRGQTCQYGESKRHGRPAQNSQSNSNSQQCQSSPKQKANGGPPIRVREPETATIPESGGPDEWLASMINEAWDDAPTDGPLRNVSAPAFASLSSEYLLPNAPAMPVSLGGGMDLDSVFLDSDMSGCCSDGLQTDWDGTTQCEHESSCTAVALHLLKQSSVVDAVAACPRRGSDARDMPPPSLETIVSTNMFDIQSLSMLLDCSCSLNGNMLHMIWLTISNIISWYARAATSSSSRSPLAKDPQPTTPKLTFSFQDFIGGSATGLEGFMKNIGGPGDCQVLTAAQTFLNDLYQIQDIVNCFSQWVQTAGLRDESKKPNSTDRPAKADQSSDIQAAMSANSTFLAQTCSSQVEADLRRRLRAVTLEVVQILVQG